MNSTTITIDVNTAYAIRRAARRSVRNVRGKIYKTRNHIRAQINYRKNMFRQAAKKRARTMILSIVAPYPENDIDIVSSNYSNDRINAADGNFFEKYSEIQCKQENRNRLDSQNQDDDHYEDVHVPPSEPENFDEVDSSSNRLLRWTKKENDFLYKISLSAIENRLGLAPEDEDIPSNLLFDYVKNAFCIPDDDHNVLLLESSSEQEALIPILNVTVITANGLEAKDPNGFSDPYCLLGIMPPKENTTEPVNNLADNNETEVDAKKNKKKKWFKIKKKHKKHKKEKLRDKVPEQAIKQTRVIKQNLNPVWEETFSIDLQDLQDDIFHLEIWDHDDDSTILGAMRNINEVVGMKGMGRYFKQIVHNAKNTDGNVDDFLGSIDIPIKDIPSHGKTNWFKLEGKSQKSKAKGKIKLQLHLGYRREKDEETEEEVEDRMSPVECYRCILTRFIEHELQQMGNSNRWDGTLNRETVYILHQLAIQNQLTPLNFAYSRWLAYSKAHTLYAMDYRFLHSLLKTIDEQWKKSQEKSDQSFTTKEKVALADSFDAFVKYCIGLLRKQRDVFPPHKKNVSRLEWLLKCLQHLQALEIYKKLCPAQTDIQSQIINGIQEGTVEWFHRIHAFSEPGTTKDGDVVAAMAGLTNTLNIDLIRSYKYTGKLYQAMLQIDYFSIAYKSFDSLLGEEVIDLMKGVNERLKSKATDSTDISTFLFELYLALKDFLTFRMYLNKSDAEALVLANYHKFFKRAVQNWLSLAYAKAKQRIEKAVELDQVRQVDAMVKHSSSAVDVACCFGQIREFYSKLNWPDVEESYVFVTKITDDICQAAMFYADIIHQKLISKGYYDEEGQFDVTDQLCIAINNIEQVRRSLGVLPKSLNWDKLWLSVTKKQGEQSSDQCKASLEAMLASADDDMMNIIARVAGRVGDKMRPDIKKFVFQLAYTPVKQSLDDAITPLMLYLDKNLITLNEGLLRSNFDRILETLWQVVLDEIREQVIGEHEQHSHNNGHTLGSHTIHVLKSTIGDYTKKKIGAHMPNFKKSKSLKARTRRSSSKSSDDQKGPEFFARLHSALEILIEFFNADGKGLQMKELMNDDCKTLLSCLVTNKSSTEELIVSYYGQRVQDQLSMVKSPYGTLDVICYYNPMDCKLFVEVTRASNLKALDCNGVSDPFVFIELCPRHMFSVDPQKTKVIKKTLNPVFRQSFEFDVMAEQCKQRGACVMFSVMDHDLMFSNDLEGEAVISLESIPGINMQGSCSQQVSLHLMKPVQNDEDQTMFTVMSNRHGDKRAADFVKKRYHAIDQAKSM
ncbi:BAI1-associated protein 3-like isoform X2 [Anneissia japonica]|uniref:BAI1-associated protein 3-like isoform X2 n=1 Tax=Anneissia japonica TaxID=1529436 RepID=UPI00142558B1|nr:BAI1-associated protein 3-like isoform X2 [Anneissia japonica]